MSRTTLTALALLVVALAATNSAIAGGCGGKKYYGGSNLHHRYISKHNHGVYKQRTYHRPVVVKKRVVDPCHRPQHCLAYVCPGDTWQSLCEREYGNPHVWQQVASFNQLPPQGPVPVGQTIRLPEIFESGRMNPSQAPAPAAPPENFMPNLPPQNLQPQMPNAQMPGTQMPQANIRQAERKLPTFTTGSQLALDGQEFGGTPGQVQLVIGPMALPVAVVDWTPSEVTIELPQLPLTEATDARVVVLGSDGQMLTQSEIRLAPATSRLAMEN